MQQMIGLIGTILTIALFGGLILLYIYARIGGLGSRPTVEDPEKVSSSDKLRMSKTSDAAFFDGESEEYAETMSRLRQYGGA